MLALLKLIQSMIKTLHSAGTPGQVAAGMALGSALGLTPLMNLHNLAIFALLVLLNISFGGGMLGWALFVPVGFLLDPLFDSIGLRLLTASLDRVDQHPDSAVYQLQQFRSPRQLRQLGGSGCSNLLCRPLWGSEIPGYGRRASPSVTLL
jgi:uncharacterized protein (TIGR03546 family)